MAEKTDDLLISISTDMATVRRSLKRLEGDISSTTANVQKQFDGLGKGIDKSLTTSMQTRIDAMVGIGAKATKEWTGALADQGAEFDRLRSKFNPVFSTITRYKATVSEIQQAHRMGAISADEMTAAIGRERQAALASIAAIKQRNAALADTPIQRGGVGSFQTSNIAAQFQDIAVTSAMGMSPLQIALQQGTQLSAVFEQMKGSGQSAGAGLLAAFTSIISPISLVTIGLVGATAAAVQYFSSASKGTESLDDILARHEKNIQRLGPAYEAVRKKANEYATDPSVVNALLSDDMKKAQAKLKEEIGNTLRAIEAELLQFAAKNNGSLLGNRLAPAEELIQSLRESKIEIGEFLKQATALETAGKLSPEAAMALRGYATAADETARAIAGMTPNVSEADTAFGNLSKAIENITTDSARTELQTLVEQAQKGGVSVQDVELALNNLSGTAPDLSAAAGNIFDLFQKAIAAKAAIDALSGPIGGETVAGGKGNRVGAMDRAQEQYNQALLLAKRFGELNKQIGSVALPGLSGARGGGISEAEREKQAIDDVIASLQFEQEQIGRTATEQRIYNELKRAGVDLNSAAGKQIADLVAKNAELAESQAKLNKAQQDFNNGLEQLGADAIDALGNVIAGTEDAADAFKKLGIEILKSALTGKGAYSDFFASLSGGQGGGGILGTLFGFLGGGSSFNPTPGGFAQMLGIPGYANGTLNHPGGLAIVGEKGPELLNLPRGAQVFPKVPKALSAPSSQAISVAFAPNITVQGGGGDSGEQVTAALKRFEREFTPRVVKSLREAKTKGMI